MWRVIIYSFSPPYEAPNDLQPSPRLRPTSRLTSHSIMMKLLMISGDRSVLEGKHSAFWYTLQGFRKHWDRIDIICPRPDPAMGLQQGPHEHRPEGQEGGEVFLKQK